MECALGWPEGLHLLAAAGAVAIPAIELAIFRQDVDSVAEITSTEASIFLDADVLAEAPSFYPWKSSGRSNGVSSSVLQASLCLHCRQAGDSICSLKKPRPCCPHNTEVKGASSETRDRIRRILVAAVKQRRDELAKLALEHLPVQKCRELGVGLDLPLDSSAFAVYTALVESGVFVPAALYPGTSPLLLSFNILCHSGGFPLAQALFDNRLCELNVAVDGVNPLASTFEESLANGEKEVAIRWLLDNGASAVFPSRDMMPNFLFYLASVYDSADIYDKHLVLRARELIHWDETFPKTFRAPKEYVVAPSERKTTPTMIGLVAQYCNPLERDSCNCPCSSGGCLSLHKFRNGIALGNAAPWPGRWNDYRLAKRWSSVSETLLSWIRDCQLDDTQAREYLRDACRLEVFTRLGMAHRCCVFDIHHDRPFPTPQERDKELCQELEDEDTELAEQLEGIMETYDAALSESQGTTEEFWTRWWAGLQGSLPEIPAEERKRGYADHGTVDYCEGGRIWFSYFDGWTCHNIYS